MPDITMAKASIDARGFYVPQFELHIEGAQLPSEVLRDVVDITYKDKLDEIDSCELTVNNWNADRREFKYVGSEILDPVTGAPKLPPRDRGKAAAAAYWKVFDPCSKTVRLYLGYSGELELMLTGNFTTLEPNFPSSGPPTLQVRLLNQMHKLRVKKYSDKYVNTTDTKIAEEIAKKRDPQLGNLARFPIPIFTNPTTPEPTLVYVGQKNQYDIDFLWSRARVRNYAVFMFGEGKDQTLYFGKSNQAKDPIVYQLEWGRSLIDFKPTLTTANQYRSVTVRGWDRATQKSIEEKADLADPELAKLNGNLHHLLEQCDPREEFVEEVPMFTKDQAKKLARDLLGSQLKRMVRAVGTTVGLPKLRAGSRVRLGKSVGDRLSGIYFVTSTTHTFNNNGYTTRFEARREDEQSGAMP